MPWKAEGAAGGGSEQDRGREHGARWGYGSTLRGAPSMPGASCNVRRAGGDVAGVGAAGVRGEGGKRWVTPRLNLVSGLTQQESDYKFREAFPSRFLFLFSFFLFFSIHRFYFLEPS